MITIEQSARLKALYEEFMKKDKIELAYMLAAQVMKDDFAAQTETLQEEVARRNQQLHDVKDGNLHHAKEQAFEYWKKAEPFIAQRKKPKIIAKTKFLKDLEQRHPELQPSALAQLVFKNSPDHDDGISPFFFWITKDDRVLIDRKSNRKISSKHLAGQISKARNRD